MNRLDSIEPFKLEELADLLAFEARAELSGPSSETGVPIFAKMALSSGPLKMQADTELFSAEPFAELFPSPANTGLHAAATRKWSSLAVAVLMHCFLFAAFFFAGSSQPPGRNSCVQVQLVASSGGWEAKGGGGSLRSLAAGSKSAAKASPRRPPAVKLAPAHLPAPTEHRALEKRPAHTAMAVRKARRTSPPKPALKKKPAGARPLCAEHKPAPRSQIDRARGKTPSGGPDIAQAVPGAGPGHCGEAAGSGVHLPAGSGGAMKVGFGTANGPRFLHRVAPSYPEFALKQQIQGRVLLRLLIDKHGRVVDVEVIKKAGFGFDEAAVKAIRESTFIPAKDGGKPRRCIVLLPIRFELQ